MAHRADDLLSIFDPHRPPPRQRAVEGRAASREPRGGKKGPLRSSSLLSSQRLLLGSAAALLLILAFVVGLAVGRPRALPPSPALSRTAPLESSSWVMIRAQVERISRSTQKPIAPERLVDLLTKQHQVPKKAILDVRATEDRLLVELGPFRSAEEADRWIESLRLRTLEINLDTPFRYHEVLPYAPPPGA